MAEQRCQSTSEGMHVRARTLYPRGEASFFQPVPLTEIKRFGHWHCFCEARTPIVAEMQDGRILLAPLSEQTSEVIKVIKRRLCNEEHPNYRALSRDVPELFSWEIPAIVGAITLADFPEAIRPFARRAAIWGIPPQQTMGWIVSNRDLSYDKQAHAWLKANGFNYGGGKWVRADDERPVANWPKPEVIS